jgi:hypothetical protein
VESKKSDHLEVGGRMVGIKNQSGEETKADEEMFVYGHKIIIK